MNDMHSFEQQLASGLDQLAGPRRSVDAMAISRDVIATQSPKWRFQSMFSATKFVVAGAILALFGGFLLSGVLTQQPSDDGLPAVGASASATAQAEPTDAATTEPEPTTDGEADATTLDLLPGVDLVTEEVEPGVYRVVSDRIRDLSRPSVDRNRWLGGILDTNIVAGLDGSVWLFGLDDFFRLGDETIHRWPKGIVEDFPPGQADFEVGPDGTVWLSGPFGVPGKDARAQIWSYDGQAWSERWRGANAKRWAYGVEVQQDGTVWMAWFTNQAKKGDAVSGPVRAARLSEESWEILPGNVGAGSPGHVGDVIMSEGGGDLRVMSGYSGRLYRHDGQGWVSQEMTDLGGVLRAAVGSDGTLWVRLNAECDPDKGPCVGVSDTLARLDDDGWEVYDASDGIPMMGDHYMGFEGFFEVAPDSSVWFNPIGDYERTGTECDGVARFDGDTMRHFLRDHCVSAMDMASDGTVWLRATEALDEVPTSRVRWTPAYPTHTYVITPEAVAASE